MPKTIDCPVKRFEGSITLPDSLTYPQLIAWEQAMAKARTEGAGVTESWYDMLPGFLACVESWRLRNVPEHPTQDTFPSTPRTSALKLGSWLFGEIQKLILAEDDLPNA